MPQWICNRFYILSHLAHVYLVTVSSCDTGWFGTNCQYKCHCRNNQCDSQGDCTNGSKCERSWFGPSCQYQDVANIGNPTFIPDQDKDLVLDGDDDTCHDNLQQIILTWSMNHPFSWLRVTARDTDPDSLLNLTVLLKPSKADDVSVFTKCHNKRTYYVTNRTVDVYCDVREGFQEILIFGEGIQTLCSLCVNGGRNVALKQTAWQSSTEKNIGGVASRAVDGTWLGLFKDNSCTHTDLNDRTPLWKLTLPRPVTVSRFEILNRNDCCQRRLMFFSLETFSENNSSVHYYKDSTDSPQNSFTILSFELKEPITLLVIAAYNEWNGHIVLTLCEVELYGDTVCPAGSFGRDCEQKCNCAVMSESCLVSTGNCLSGCAAGYHGEGCHTECLSHFWGINCLNRCNKHCIGSTCNRVTGQCIHGCKAGFNPPNCTEECDNGSYGVNCSQPCPENCSGNKCNHVTGVCDFCKIGYQGDTCDEACDPGRHGPNCSLSCPVKCEGQSCDSVTGHCFNCTLGYMGVTCQDECEEGFYGINCSQQCPERCVGDKCSHVSGRCDICQIGYHGDQCDKVCDAGYHGPNCSLHCPLTCEGQSCDSVTGHCLRCNSGYKGNNCQQVCDVGFYGLNCSELCPKNCSGNTCHHVTGKCDICEPGFQGHGCETACSAETWGPICSEPCPSQCHDNCDVRTGSCRAEASLARSVDNMTHDCSAVFPILGLLIAFSLIFNAVLFYENRRLKEIKENYSSDDTCGGRVITQENNCIL